MSQSFTEGAFPKYAPLTQAGKEYEPGKTPNPFAKYTIENFFSAAFMEELKKSSSQPVSSRANYMMQLYHVAKGFINGDRQIMMAVSPLVTNINPIHPFLEPSGAIRVQVPLPQNMEQLYILVDQILGNKTKNRPNNDMYKFTPKGMADPNFPGPWLGIGTEKIYLKNGEKPYNRGLLIWDDPGGYAGVNTENRCPNLTLLLLSIMFQQTDVDSYGSRGRYGDATLKRLLDGHGVQCSDRRPAHRMISMVSFDAESGMPKGYITAAVYDTEVPGEGSQPRVVKTIFNHYAFVPTCSKSGFGPTITARKMTEIMYMYLLAYITTYITEKPLRDHFLVAHSDKSPAIKSVCKAGDYDPKNKEIYKLIADAAYDAITLVESRFDGPERGLKVAANVPGFPNIQFYDQSTVPRDDPGEEVPVPSDRFYIPVYEDYCKIVSRIVPTAKPPKQLVNGKIEAKHFTELKKIAAKYGYPDVNRLVQWMQSPGSMRRDSVDFGMPMVDEDLRVVPDFPINDRSKFSEISVVGLNPKPELDGISLDEFKKDILNFLIQVAKDGNSGNIDYTPIPRLTDFAYMVTYQIPTGYKSPIDWGVAIAVQHMVASFAHLQHRKISYLGPSASQAHQKILLSDLAYLFVTMATGYIMVAGFKKYLDYARKTYPQRPARL